MNTRIIIPRPPSRVVFFDAFSTLLNEEQEMIGSAYVFSKAGHARQFRVSGERYFDHPKAVTWILVTELKIIEWQYAVDSLLHDIREDTFLLSHQRIMINFGLECAIDIDALTRRGGESVEEFINRIFLRGVRVILIKLADRLHNMRTLASMPKENQINTTRTTLEVYLPLVDRLKLLLPSVEMWRADYFRLHLETECQKFQHLLAK